MYASITSHHQQIDKQRGRHRETLRTRFNKYAVSGRLLGPSQEEGDKMAIFRELQLRGFSLWYRCGLPEMV